MNRDYTEQINDEATSYAIEIDSPNRTAHKMGFIVGVNSNIATKIKLEFALEQLKLINKDFVNGDALIEQQIRGLKQQLKDLKL